MKDKKLSCTCWKVKISHHAGSVNEDCVCTETGKKRDKKYKEVIIKS